MKHHLTLNAWIEHNDQEIEITIRATYTAAIPSSHWSDGEPEYLDIDEMLDDHEQPLNFKLTGPQMRQIGVQLLEMGRDEARIPRFQHAY